MRADTSFEEATKNAVSAPSFIACLDNSARSKNLRSLLRNPTFDSRADDSSFLAGTAQQASLSDTGSVASCQLFWLDVQESQLYMGLQYILQDDDDKSAETCEDSVWQTGGT